MGSGSSRTRKLTLDNEDASNVIKVSEDVVQRLKSDSQEKSEALKKNDEYWERRIKDLESYHMEMHKVMEGEYNKAINEMNTKEKKLYACDTPPCQISKARVLECYKRNPNQAMKCLKEVEAFTACVDLQRSILIDAKAAS
ncbi:MICOS complex subunit MIC19 isoform X2 [Photinus pyralis]|uniref:MICOS complex subunit MIC19 isoform X2 n=1 Tax=Photinus pyralis TaxID=7054 RepID=UPI001267153E|nr:MICOS complex subunit MIC19 isoform X2 [Photinus pyralis]